LEREDLAVKFNSHQGEKLFWRTQLQSSVNIYEVLQFGSIPLPCTKHGQFWKVGLG